MVVYLPEIGPERTASDQWRWVSRSERVNSHPDGYTLITSRPIFAPQVGTCALKQIVSVRICQPARSRTVPPKEQGSWGWPRKGEGKGWGSRCLLACVHSVKATVSLSYELVMGGWAACREPTRHGGSWYLDGPSCSLPCDHATPCAHLKP